MRRTQRSSLSMKLFAFIMMIATFSASFTGSASGIIYAKEPLMPTQDGGLQPLTQNGSSLYYYVDGQRIQLTPSLEWVSVKFTNSDAEEQSKITAQFADTLSSMEGAREIPHMGITLLPLKDGLATKSLVQGINSMRATPASFSQVNPVYSYDRVNMVVGDEFIAAFHPSASLAEIDSINASYGVERLSAIAEQQNTFVLRITASSPLDALAMSNLYQESGIAIHAAPNFVRIMASDPVPTTEKITSIAPQFTPNDTFYVVDQWYLHNTQQYGSFMTADADIDAPEAWDITKGDASIIIAVIDEGVDFVHEDLSANMVGGYDATGLGSAGAPFGDDAHGTAVAGIAAAVSNNAIGVAGVCQLCKIMPIRIAYGDGNGGWITMDSWIANAITWAYTNGADVLNNSWGGGTGSTSVNTAITNAVTLGRDGTGSVVLAAAGNENNSSVIWPASQSNVIAVGALNMCDQRKSTSVTNCNGWESWGSNYGTALDIAAPGVWLTTTDISGTSGYGSGASIYGEDYYGFMNGTSGATPIVAGVAGLVLSVSPDMPPADVQHLLQNTADNLGVAGWDNETGYGRVNAARAVEVAQKSDLVVTGYEFRNADNTATIPYPVSGEAFWIRMTIQNQGGAESGAFYPGIFLDDKPNYGPDLSGADLGRVTDFSGYRISPSNSSINSAAGCLYYDPGSTINPLTENFTTERGNYTIENSIAPLSAGATTTSDVYIGYPAGLPSSIYDDPIYDDKRIGLADGSYKIYLYADPKCSSAVEEGLENNNSYGPITVNIPYVASCALPMTDTPIFGDVPVGHWAREYVEALYTCGYTAGCSASPLMYCPSNGMTRVESSVFILRGNFGSTYVPPSSVGSFGDNWSSGTWGEKWAQGLLNAGLTAGCSSSPLLFCPWDQTPRVQLAVFGVRLMHGSNFVPPAATGAVFADMTDVNYYGTKWAEQAYADGLIPACGTSGGKPLFCPGDLVDRALAAYTVVKAKNLLP